MFPQPIALTYRHSNINLATHTCHSTGLIHNPTPYEDNQKVCSVGGLTFKEDHRHDLNAAFLFEDIFLPLMSG